MSIPSFFDKENISLLVNISGGCINASLILFQKNQVPKFLYSVNVPFVAERQDNPRFSKEAGLLLDTILKDTIKNGWNKISGRNKKISHVIVSFSSPWFIFKTREIHISQDTSFVITKTFLDSILLKEEKLFEKEFTKGNPELSGDRIEIIEKSIVHTKMNGYTVDDVIGKRTKVFDAFMCISAISQSLKEKVEDIVLKHTHIPKENIIMHSFPLVLFSATRDNFESGVGLVLININPEITDVIFVNNNIIESITSFPFGKNTIIRLISKTFKISPEIAESQLIMYLSQKINEQVSGVMQNLLQDLEKEWAIYFEDALLTLSPNMIWPKKTFVMVENRVSSIFIEFLKIRKTDATVNFRKNTDIILMDESILSPLYNNNIKTLTNESLVTLAIFYNKFFQNK